MQHLDPSLCGIRPLRDFFFPNEIRQLQRSNGDEVLYSDPPTGLEHIAASQTRHYLFPFAALAHANRRDAKAWLELSGITRNNLDL